jgi:hypothetical protein
MIDNVVWTDSWLSIAGASCSLTSVGVGEEQARKSLPVRPPHVKKTSRLGSRDPVASGVKGGPHGGKNDKMMSWTVSWLIHKTKVEPGLRGSQVMSGDWRRLHQVCRVYGGSLENHRVTQMSHIAGAEDQACPSGQNRPDRFGELVRPVWPYGLS